MTSPAKARYARLTTARKGQYKLTLPDGTAVWLNAESSLRYPLTFTGKERVVELQGEAYFEVKHNAQKPFIVQTPNQRLKVLGTVFNVSDYPNEEQTVTTLVQGKVSLSSPLSQGEQVLHPDKQAVLNQRGYQIADVDVRAFTAWKENEFRFKATPLPEVMRQLERWYDLDIDYAQVPKDIRIHALIRRDKKLSSVLYALEQTTNIKFRREGRRLVLMKE